MNEPVAVRYEFDGHGYLYMDAGSGSDWASRVKNCEFLYTHPLTNAEPVAWINPNTINHGICLLYTSPSPRDRQKSRMPSSA